jgi:hypothetical protein
MATTKQKDQLIDYLKFTPRTYTIKLTGYGGEIVMGTVNRKAYNYCQEHDICLDEYIWGNLEIPDEFQPFHPDQWYECDNIAHECGVEMSSACYVTVYDENEDEVWSHCLDPYELHESGIEAICISENEIDDFSAGTVVFVGQSFEKGLFFGGTIDLAEPFSPKHLKFEFSDVDSWSVCNSVEYRGEQIDSMEYDTTGKSSSYLMTLVGDELTAEYLPTIEEYTEYYPATIKPIRPGVYDCIWKNSGKVFVHEKLEWNGKKWINYHCPTLPIVKSVDKWRGLNWDTSDWNNRPLFAK